MAKAALLDVLEKTIGKYVKNLDAESLNLAVWSGTLQLNSLQLNVQAVNEELSRQAINAPNLAIPLEVVSGSFTSFQVDVPWAHLMSKPVVLRAKGLSVIVAPCDRSAETKAAAAASSSSLDFQSEAERAMTILQHREKSIRFADDYRRQANALRKLAGEDEAADDNTSNNKNKDNKSSGSTFTARLVRRIIENIQIEVSDVHVSLQDTTDGMDAAAGVMLEQLSLVTTDSKGRRTFVDRTVKKPENEQENSFLYKSLLIQGLGVYLDEHSETTTNSTTAQHQLSSIAEGDNDDDNDTTNLKSTHAKLAAAMKHSFILAPMSFEAKLRQADSNVCVDYPKYTIETVMHALSIMLSKTQMDLSQRILQQLTPPHSQDLSAPLFPEYRPLQRPVPGKEGAEARKLWWKYAYRCIGRLNGRRLWAEFFLAFQKRNKYIPLYKRRKYAPKQDEPRASTSKAKAAPLPSCPWLQPLTPEEEAVLDDIEQDRAISVEGIMTWRNIADAQVDKEREKHDENTRRKANATAKPGLFSSLFGTASSASDQQEQDTDENDPPVTLTVEEMKELEAVTMEQVADAELSKDSRLADVRFTLGSLYIHLTSYGLTPLATLDMGTVSSSFDANVDGSFGFEFCLASLEIKDKVTPNSLFPSVLRNQVRPDEDDASLNDAFRMNVAKKGNGDQLLKLRLNTFEAIASPQLLSELVHFVGSSEPTIRSRPGLLQSRQNPILAQSLSGSVDIFYDATEGSAPLPQITVDHGGGGESVRFNEGGPDSAAAGQKDISVALVDAWKSKTETKATWAVDLDINAPVIVLPENCIDQRANVLVFDLGHLRLQYGNISSADNVTEWFKMNERPLLDGEEFVFDIGSLTFSNLTFLVGKANYWRRLVRKFEETGAVTDKEEIVEPISLSLDFGVQSSTKENVPRICAFGVVPVIALNVSPPQVSRISTVYRAWAKLLHDLSPPPDPGSDPRPAPTKESVSVASSREAVFNIVEEARRGSTLLASLGVQSQVPIPLLFTDITLQRLSLKIATDDGKGMESHLVYVSSTFSSFSDSTSRATLSMGFFWVVDLLPYDYPRRERLVVHSELPASEGLNERDGFCDILTDLDRLEVFRKSRGSSSDLANVTFSQSGDLGIPSQHPLSERGDDSPNELFDGVVEAEFSSLYINWNPLAIKTILAALDRFSSFVQNHEGSEVGALILSSPDQLLARPLGSGLDEADSSSEVGQRKFLVNAKMTSFSVSLNSATDDLPVFLLTMSSASLSLMSSPGDEVGLSLTLDDVNIATPEMGRTKPIYRTILGLAPDQTESLLSVRYGSGDGAIGSMHLQEVKLSDFEACALVELSPMRLVYIQAQVMALVEYLTEGILGALAAQAASSAAAAAAEIVSPTDRSKLFLVKASSFEAMLPQAADNDRYICVATGEVNVEYTALPDNGGATVKCSLKEVSLRDSDGAQMQTTPIKLDVDVSMPSEDIGTKEEQAMIVNVHYSEAPFIVTKSQYSQILRTLDSNLGEPDLCIRDMTTAQPQFQPEPDGPPGSTRQSLTHAGVVAIDTQRRIIINMQLSSLSLLLCDVEDEPIVRVDAVESEIVIRLVPDEERTCISMKLKDLACSDKRLKAIGRPHRSLIYLGDQESVDGKQRQIFQVDYESASQSSRLDLRLGSPMFVFIPDAISDVLSFLKGDDNLAAGQPELTLPSQRVVERRSVVEVEASSHDDEIEACVVKKEVSPLKTTTITVSTARCSFILVDLGSISLLPTAGSRLSTSLNSVNEAIVFQGSFDADIKSETDLISSTTSRFDTQFHGQGMEIFTAHGLGLDNPVQILEPAEVSLYLSMHVDRPNSSKYDIRVASLTAFDACVSMRNITLLNAILSSVSESFTDIDTKDGEENLRALTPRETQHIEQLADSLIADPVTQSDVSAHGLGLGRLPSGESEDVITQQSSDSLTISVKITVPEAKITLVNDLQGLDDALLRFTIQNMMCGIQSRGGERIGSSESTYTGFDMNAHTSILADYFDLPTSDWKSLLLKPWELSLKAARGRSSRFKTERPSTTIDFESFPCFLAFSEQFLMNLASANQMWSVYSTATSSALDSEHTSRNASVRMSVAASAARTLVTSLPYAVENHTGVEVGFVVHCAKDDSYTCESGMLEYFRFNQPRGSGSGARRLYGGDVAFTKSVTISIDGSEVLLRDVDSLIGCPRQAHETGQDILVTSVAKEGKTVVIHLSGGVDIHSRVSIPFSVSAVNEGKTELLGICGENERPRSLVMRAGRASRSSRNFGVPLKLLGGFRSQWNTGASNLVLTVSPETIDLPSGWKCEGPIEVSLSPDMFSEEGTLLVKKFDVICSPTKTTVDDAPDSTRYIDPLCLQVSMATELVNGIHPVVDIVLEARAVLENRLPIPLLIRTPMPHTYSLDQRMENDSESLHLLEPSGKIEIFTPGPSIAVTMKPGDMPVAGTALSYMSGFIDLPLVREYRLIEPLKCEFPFVRRTVDPLARSGPHGVEFFVIEGNAVVPEDFDGRFSQKDNSAEARAKEAPAIEGGVDWRTFHVSVANYAVDHTGDILFDQVGSPARGSYRRSSSEFDAGRESARAGGLVSSPFGAFSSHRLPGRVTLLPGSNVLIRLLHLTMEGDFGMKKSFPFRIDDVSICDGGVDSSPVKWEDGTPSGYFAYRKLISPNESEIHVVPEFIVFNGSRLHSVRVKHPGGVEFIVEPGRIAPLRTHYGETATISVEYIEFGARTSPMRVDSLGLRVAVARANDGSAVGSIAMQTVVGAKDSRLVVKLGEMKFGSLPSPGGSPSTTGIFKNDLLRFRVQWTELRITLDEGRPLAERNKAFFESALDRIREAASPSNASPSAKTWVDARRSRTLNETENIDRLATDAICTILLYRFTIDWQRVFKDEEASQPGNPGDALRSPERSQLSIIIHNVQLRDETPGTEYPVVFDSTAETSFFDLCVRTKGPLDSELVKVDLFDLNLAHRDGVSERIVVNTSEEFVWKLLDLANRIAMAAGEFVGVNMELKWDDDQGGYVVSFTDKSEGQKIDETAYTPPKSDQLYDINRARVSPFTMIVSFKRTPQASRYKLVKGVRGANIMNYFTHRLKFKIDKAELNFSRYDARSIKGPLDRLFEMLATVYFSRMKLKFVTIMTAASFQDWKGLAARDGGDDEFVEGDILRVTGNLAGNTASYVLKKAGRGLGKGVSSVTGTLGDSIENASGALGVRSVGAGVNSVVSGVGDGVNSTITGVGTGAASVFKGIGQGAGQAFGGVTGGAVLLTKGIGRGITRGDGRAVVSGLTQGATSVGTGVGQGFESVVMGTGDGIMTIGEGLFSGFRSVGKGIGDAFRGKPPGKSKDKR